MDSENLEERPEPTMRDVSQEAVVPPTDSTTLPMGFETTSTVSINEEIVSDLAETHPLIGSEFLKLDHRSIQLDTIGSAIFTAVVTVASMVGLVILWFNVGFGWIFYSALMGAFLVIVALSVLTLIWPKIEYRRASYRIDDQGLEIRRGVFWRHKITVPIGRVQHADVSQGPLQRMYGLATLSVHTAGTQNSSVGLSGLSHELALEMRDLIVHQRKEQDAV